MSDESWQLYDENGLPLMGRKAPRQVVTEQGLLHGASHVWFWRIHQGVAELLLQRRAGEKMKWPHRLDISAAGHIDLNEDPVSAALRETHEELGIKLQPADLFFAGAVRWKHAIERSRLVENELQWVYFAHWHGQDIIPQLDEVSEVLWFPSLQLREELIRPVFMHNYVPHGEAYWATIFAVLTALTQAIAPVTA